MRRLHLLAGLSLWAGGFLLGLGWHDEILGPRTVEVCPARHLNCLIADGWTFTDPDGCPVAYFVEDSP